MCSALSAFLDCTSDVCDIQERIEKMELLPYFYKEVESLSDHYKAQLLHDLAASNYNIFVSWYKKILIELTSSEWERYSKWSKDFLNYYKKGFDKVEI